jgi:hypothetical protein
MIVGLVWPLGPQDYPDPDLLAMVRTETGATHLRFDLDYRRPDPERVVEAVRVAGFTPLPIINWPWSEGHTADVDLARYCEFCQVAVQVCALDEVEVLNEPRIMGGMDGPTYGAFAVHACRALRAAVRPVSIVLAGDYLQPDRKGPKIFPSWFEDVRSQVDDRLYDVVALHTYREPGAPDETRYPSRADEYASMRRPLPEDCPVQVTEVGWNLWGVTEEEQAIYLQRELEINRELAIGATYIYAPVPGHPDGDFGLFNHDWRPRPSARAIRAFQEAA